MVDILDDLDDAQRAAVITSARHCLTIAGPGSGKTRVLTRRVAYLVKERNVAPWNIMAITFTNKAANEMKERLGALLGEDATKLWVGTFHSVCAKLLRRAASHLGVSSDFSIADTDDARRVLRRIAARNGVEGRDAAKVAEDMGRRISTAKNALEDPRRNPDQELAWYATEYANDLRSQNLVDFDDLLVYGVKMLAAGELGDTIRNRFTHILVDEYQDTNLAQWEFLRRVASNGELFAVGDANQAIYSFRGSTPEAMESFQNDWPRAEVLQLGRNWRSTSNIVAVAAELSKRAGLQRRAQLWTTEEDGEPVRVVAYADDRDEARSVAAEIHASSAPPQECAVIVRTHATTRLIEAELTSAHVPYVIAGGTRFWDRAEVRDALAWLQLCANPANTQAFERACATPRRGLGPAAVAAAVSGSLAHNLPITEWVATEGPSVPRHGKAFAAFARDFDSVFRAAQAGPAPAVGEVLDMAGFIDTACRAAGRSDTAEDREANLDELRSAATSFVDENPGLDGSELTREFVEQAALASSADADAKGVCITTAHAAKGREFDEVWVIGVEQGLFPHMRSDDDNSIAEECRLLFVAATRARHRLCLSHAASRMVGGDILDREPSPFLQLLEPLGDSGPVAFEGAAPKPPKTAPGAYRTRRPRQVSSRFAAAKANSNRPPTSRRRGALTDPSAAPKRDPRRRDVSYKEGDVVVHDVFGAGEVVAVTTDAVRVRFGSTVRSLAPELAPMEIIQRVASDQ